ncbi:hypothetical protein T459_12503 [Capsicum annuum]|uniref:RNase H type-1 domain-containing protein n=1 Tax=Capsicum annuum TaxID=4072 RepID=A0A2G2ZPZ0_CAPAN|nr:hypothetical protein T459_12503 [Capsicum annuum]
MKLNVDGSFDSNSNVGGADRLLKDMHGDCVWGFNAKFAAQSPLHAETLALYLGLKIAKKMHCTKLIVVTYSITLASALNDAVELGITLIHHEDRRDNGVADTLAKEGRKKAVLLFFEE